jgi:anti-sigma factor RsiW
VVTIRRLMVCRDLVELVTDYLDGALDPITRSAVAEHLRRCKGCTTYVAQLRCTTTGLGSMSERPLDPAICARLMAAFRDWSAHTDTEGSGI